MSLQIITEAIAPGGTKFKVHTRDSNAGHIDCSSELFEDEYDEENAEHVKYHRRNFHTALPAAEAHHASVVAAIEAGEEI